jgi:hypothetical protein
MNWKSLQTQGRVERHATSLSELGELRAAIERNLDDAAIKQLSQDNRFLIAYQAALLTAKMAVACAGYRVKGQGAHKTTFQALKLAMGPSMTQACDYFDRCRRKRNDLTYEAEGLVSAEDAAELLRQAKLLDRRVEAWIENHHPQFTP